ncbi:MAG TPA: rhodanese-like domain-containing protein [Candidatus Limnocylindrales bacterium]|jgi:thiosulfate/3-mercaptopyruvate sulfurtransferase|nr:rhodanese-like domain-containing protein [Candidatus Limnocylindrales bacterium]
MATLTSTELQQRLDQSQLTVVDIRPLAAYNGWRLDGEARGGHVPGAVAFPAAWLGTVDDQEIGRLLDSKGISADREIVVVGSGSADAAAFAAALRERGIETVDTLDGGAAAWAADGELPLERLPRYEALVHIPWLRDVLDGRTPEAPPNPSFLLLHVNFGVPEEYAEGHIPGAHYLDTNWLEDPADWNRRSPEAIETALAALGITRDTTVVLYGRDTEGDANEKWPGRRAGQIAATRALMILRYAGVDDVRLLDGGYDWWVQGGNPVETTENVPVPVTSFGAAVPVRPEVIVDIDEAKQILADPDGAALVSVRTWREHIGNVSGYNYIGPAGRIKGDVWGNCGTDAYHMQHYRNIDNTMRAYPEITANWAEAGITPDKWVAFYCGTGWRASETWFYAYLQGWQRIAVYDGGWFEWSQDPINNPIEIGEPDGEAAA